MYWYIYKLVRIRAINKALWVLVFLCFSSLDNSFEKSHTFFQPEHALDITLWLLTVLGKHNIKGMLAIRVTWYHSAGMFAGENFLDQTYYNAWAGNKMSELESYRGDRWWRLPCLCCGLGNLTNTALPVHEREATSMMIRFLLWLRCRRCREEWHIHWCLSPRVHSPAGDFRYTIPLKKFHQVGHFFSLNTLS